MLSLVVLNTAILLGIESSYNYGEDPPAAIVQLVHEHLWGDARIYASTMDKTESHTGYSLGVDTDLHPRIGPLIGLGWHYRDGGPWTKTSVWLRGGLALKAITAVLAWDLTSENRVRLGELRARWGYSRLLFENRLGISRYNGNEWGILVSVSLGFRLRN